MTDPDPRLEQGMRVRREVLGDEHVDRAIDRTTDLTRDFQELITRYAWGDTWSRPGLDPPAMKARPARLVTAMLPR